MQVQLPDNIQKYQIKQIAGLSKRQIGYLILAVMVFGTLAGLSVWLIPGGILGKSVGLIVALICSIPFVVVGFFKYMGLTAGELVRRILAQLRGKDYRPYRRERL